MGKKAEDGAAGHTDRDRESLTTEARKLREEGLSLRAVAGRLGLPHSTLADWLGTAGRARQRKPRRAAGRKGGKRNGAGLALVKLGKETEEERLSRELREAREHPAAQDPALLRGRLLRFAWRALRRLEEQIDKVSYRDLVGGLKIAAELAKQLDSPGVSHPAAGTAGMTEECAAKLARMTELELVSELGLLLGDGQRARPIPRSTS